MSSPLTKKLGMKPDQRVLILNAPDGYAALLGELPDGTRLADVPDDTAFDVVQVFVTRSADVAAYAPQALAALKANGFLWLTYPKKTSKVKTDISRDVGWEALHAAGYEGIALIAVDETWSAMRFRPSSDIRSRQ